MILLQARLFNGFLEIRIISLIQDIPSSLSRRTCDTLFPKAYPTGDKRVTHQNYRCSSRASSLPGLSW